MSDIEASYKDTIIGNLVNSGIAYLLLHPVQCWSACEFYEENKALSFVLYFSHDVYILFSSRFVPYQHTMRKGETRSKILNNLPHFIKNRLHVDCLKSFFVVYSVS